MATFTTTVCFNDQATMRIKLPDGVMWLRPNQGAIRVKTIDSPSVEAVFGKPEGYQSQGKPYWHREYAEIVNALNLAYGTDVE
jgi:hypothetical protein